MPIVPLRRPLPPAPAHAGAADTGTAPPTADAAPPENSRRDRLAAIPLTDVFEALGAEGRQDGDRWKWKIPGVGNIVVKPHTQRWKNVNQLAVRPGASDKGYGGVSLVVMALGLPWNAAMDWLEEHCGPGPSHPLHAAAGVRQDVQPMFQPPQPSALEWSRVRAYLTGHATGQRGIPGALVDHLERVGRVYATANPFATDRPPAAHAVFLGAAGAEIRAVDPNGFKGSAPGTDPDLPTLRVDPLPGTGERVAALCEAAISAMSYTALCPTHFAFSSNGAGKWRAQYRLAVDLLEDGYTVVNAQDADAAGDAAAQHLANLIMVRARLMRAGIAPDIADAALAGPNPQVRVMLSPSPHHRWLDAATADCPVWEQGWDADGVPAWLDQGRRAAPCIEVDIAAQGSLPAIWVGRHHWVVTSAARANCLRRLPRARPPEPDNDWNDVLVRRLGAQYTQAWDAAAARALSTTPADWPSLPPDIAPLRQMGVPLRTNTAPSPWRRPG